MLTLGILGGFVSGIVNDNPMQGVLIGTGVGTALALLVWLVDHLRHGPGG